jgi:hypothetical protein
MIVVERNPIIAVGQNLGHGAIELQQLFLGHGVHSNSMPINL